jgi:hypothetical protein
MARSRSPTTLAKVALEVFIGSTAAAFSVAHDEVGINELLKPLAPADFVIVEATGGIETPVPWRLWGSTFDLLHALQFRAYSSDLALHPRNGGWLHHNALGA